MAADSLAKQSLIDPNIVIFYTSPPVWLVNFLYIPFKMLIKSIVVKKKIVQIGLSSPT